MNRLLPELDRLYGSQPGVARPHGRRAAVLEVALPAGWAQLSAVWRGVQADLDLPAPAIAVSGVDALQLWFSVGSPTSSSTLRRFLQGLRERYLADVAAKHVRIFVEAGELPTTPPVEIERQRWSAFVTPDLASVFAETPWLDIPPTDEGQATILRALEPMSPAAFSAALGPLGATDGTLPVDTPALPAAPPCGPRQDDPVHFLTGVMNDAAAPLALRIEAARILLAQSIRPRSPSDDDDPRCLDHLKPA